MALLLLAQGFSCYLLPLQVGSRLLVGTAERLETGSASSKDHLWAGGSSESYDSPERSLPDASAATSPEPANSTAQEGSHTSAAGSQQYQPASVDDNGGEDDPEPQRTRRRHLLTPSGIVAQMQ